MALVVAGIMGCSGFGCVLGTDFRRVATPAVHTGVSSILNGLVDGLFAAIELESDGDGSDDTTTAATQ
ncbi:MAG: hypothetical protein HY763_06175 [Planctomycetes bacterium]|nr:hypothetical protein [Planctomycetota bacterium]